MASTEPTTDDSDTTAGDGPEDGQEEERLGTVSTLEDLGSCKRRIKAEVPTDKVEEELDRNYRELISTVQIPGFRRGHVPRRLLEKRYGEEIEGDVKEALLNMSFAEVVKEKELKVLGKPRFDNISFHKGEPLKYEVELEVQPEFELGAYTGLEVEAEALEAVKPEEIDHEIDHLRQHQAVLGPVDPAEAGPADLLLGHYHLLRDGIKVHAREEVRFRPDSGDLDGFEIADLADRVAARAGAPSFKVPAKVPPQYPAEVLRGAEVELEFFIEDARRLQLPEVDDELARKFDQPDLATLKSRIEKQIANRRKAAHQEKVEAQVLDKLAEGMQFDMPEGLLEEQLKMAKLKLEFAMIQEGRAREEIDAELQKIDEKEAGEEIRRDFKRFFILEKIAEVEKIFATEDEVNLRVALLAQAYRRPMKTVYMELEENGRLETIRTEIRHAKVRRFLREKARITGPGAAALAEEAAAADSKSPEEEPGVEAAGESSPAPAGG